MHTDIDWTAPPALRLGCLGVLQNERGEVLLVEKSYKEGPDRFGLPGGCAHQGEDARTAARREIREELGLEIEPGAVLALHYMPGNQGAAPGENVVFDCGTISSVTRYQLSDEITATHWADPHEVQDFVAPYTAHRISAALATADGAPVRYLVGHP